jgi:LemA protein
MELVAVVVLIVGAVVVVGVVAMYNGLVRRRLRTDETWAQVAVALKRRHDLVPNLVNAVRGYMGFEQAVLTQVTDARAAAVGAGAQGPAAGEAENLLTGALRSLFAVVENYPELKANENVRSLQEQLATTEGMIAAARDAYNAALRDYSTAIATFPAVLMAGPMGFAGRAFFEAEPAAAQAPSVELR